jgi:tight adherence protein C
MSEIWSGFWETLWAQFASMSRFDLLFAAVCALVALFSLVRLWLVGKEEEVEEKLRSVRGRYGDAPAPEASRLDRDSVDAAPWYDRLGALIGTTMAVGPKDRARLTRLLGDAGFKSGNRSLATLIALKLAALILLTTSAWIGISFYGLFASSAILRVIALLGALLIGWRAPDAILKRLALGRRRRIEQGLPDALDLMVISAEAGLSFEQGIDFVAREMGVAMRDLSEEFAVTSAELRVLGDRRQALQNFANRVNLQAVRSIVSTLTQTMRYGTPLAHSLRLLAAEMRTARLLRMEERAARMPVLLTLPLMGFILPALVIVCAGPAILQGIDGFRQLLSH